MANIPGMQRPDLQALPQIRDRMTFLYIEHCTIGRQDGAITVTDERGTVHVPLFPAWAGVIPMRALVVDNRRPFPRMGGGDPAYDEAVARISRFSPHGRG